MSQAYADGTEPPLPSGAKERAYIDQMASEAGLSDSEFVATTIGSLSATTGMVLSANPGIRLIDATLGDNLDNLISAADYPAWDTLTETQQASYGSKVNYDSTKYVALMEAFDLSDGFSRFAETGSSGGGFVFTSDESNRLKKIGNIGKNWTKNIGNSIEELRETLKPGYDEILYKYLYGTSQGGQTGELEYNGENYVGWNDSWNVNYKSTNVGYIEYGTSISKWKAQSSSEVYLVMIRSTTVSNSNVVLTDFSFFSKTPFTYGGSSVASIESNVNLRRESQQYTTADGDVYYYGDIGVTIFGPLVTSSQTISHFGGDIRKVEREILFGEGSGSGSGGTGELVPDIEGYPETEIPAATDIYYPTGGINPGTTWNQYVTVQRPENPFNPDDETSTPEWHQETKQNIQGLQGIRFDKLFPFCLYYDLQKFWQKVQTICGIQTSGNGTITTQASSAYDEIELRFYIPDVIDDTWTFDLEPLRNILLIVKPFMLVFLIGVEIISLIMLWKGILTGQ